MSKHMLNQSSNHKSSQSKEVEDGKRFEFGKNWNKFHSVLNEERISRAELSLKKMLEVENLKGKKILDIGSGSGLFSLAARRLGAQVHSFDYDPQSVACTSELRNRFFPDDNQWVVEEGSVLDLQYIQSLGEFDIVYSWGVLHHTGDMWKALSNAQIPVSNQGTLFIAIYNDQWFTSKLWLKVKQLYCSGYLGKAITVGVYSNYYVFRGLVSDILRLRNPIARYRDYKNKRGMSMCHDWIDWLGGYPFEVATPEEIIDFYRKNQFLLAKLTLDRGHGNNQFVFRKFSDV